MIDPDLQKQFDLLNSNLVAIQTKKGPGVWRSFFNGMFGALGYIAGLLIVVLVFGFILQKTGLLKPLQDEFKNFSSVIEAAGKMFGGSGSGTNPVEPKNSPSGNAPQSNAVDAGQGSTLITLPNGQQVHVNLPANFGQPQ